jgi:THO complex subunit 2
MANSCTMDDYAKKIPSLDRLVSEYHVSADVAFFLWRPLFSYKIGVRGFLVIFTILIHSDYLIRITYVISQLKYDELRRAEKSHKSMTVHQRQHKYATAADHVFAPVAQVMRDFLPSKTWEDISPQFYVTFWSLSLYDLFVPTDAYTREISRVKTMAIQAGDNKDLPSSKRKKEQERCNILIEKMQEEERRQRDHVDRVMAKLRDVRN